MMTLESLQRQIEIATDLSSVVSTMKTLAAVNIHQYERATEALAEYNRTIELGFHIALKGESVPTETAELGAETGAVVFGSDQGMCGQFNEEIVSYTRDRQSVGATKNSWRLLVVGARARNQLADANLAVDHAYAVPKSVSDITNLVQELLPCVERWREESGLARLFVFYNRRVTASSFEPNQLQLLPIDPDRLHAWRREPWKSFSLPLFVTDRRKMLSLLIRHYLFVSLFRACAESLASENASRIAAMQAAENNIQERLEELRGSFNHLRQSAITEELLDLVTGFEALTSRGTK